jgi:hypothetical protein
MLHGLEVARSDGGACLRRESVTIALRVRAEGAKEGNPRRVDTRRLGSGTPSSSLNLRPDPADIERDDLDFFPSERGPGLGRRPCGRLRTHRRVLHHARGIRPRIDLLGDRDHECDCDLRSCPHDVDRAPPVVGSGIHATPLGCRRPDLDRLRISGNAPSLSVDRGRLLPRGVSDRNGWIRSLCTAAGGKALVRSDQGRHNRRSARGALRLAVGSAAIHRGVRSS